MPATLSPRPSTAHPSTAWCRVTSPASQTVGVDRRRGIIHGAVVAQAGAVRGHGFRFDDESIHMLSALGCADAQGKKSRLGHPALSDGGQPLNYLGRYHNFSVTTNADGVTQLRAALHFDPTAYDIPGKGDVATHLMDRAESDPLSLMNSIVFRYQLVDKDGKAAERSDDTNAPLDELPFARPQSLLAVDVVDEGAATSSFLSGDAALSAGWTEALDELLQTGYGLQHWVRFLERYLVERPQHSQALGLVLDGLRQVPAAASSGVDGNGGHGITEIVSGDHDSATSHPTTQEPSMPASLTLETLQQNHADLYSAVVDHGRVAALQSLTLEQLKELRPDLHEKVFQAGSEHGQRAGVHEGRGLGIRDERSRATAVLRLTSPFLPNHGAQRLLQAAREAVDLGEQTEQALQRLEEARLQANALSAPVPVAPAGDPTPEQVDPPAPPAAPDPQAELQARFEADADLQQVFGSFAFYAAFCRWRDTGRIRQRKTSDPD